MTILLRRKKLGKTSCEGIVANMNSPAVVVRNDKVWPEGHDTVIRWGTTSNIPFKAKVINEAKAIHWVADKSTSRKLMADAGLAPMTWLSIDAFLNAEHDVSEVVIRPSSHHQGRNFHYINSNDADAKEQLEAFVRQYGEGNYYISEYIDKTEEYRVFVGSGKAVWVAKKTPADENAKAWNVAQGGRFDNVRWGEWNLDVVNTAIKAFNMSGLHFGGVDVMVGRDGKAYVLEINSAPSQTSPYRQECVARYFDWSIENGWDNLNIIAHPGGYKDYIHPGVIARKNKEADDGDEQAAA